MSDATPYDGRVRWLAYLDHGQPATRVWIHDDEEETEAENTCAALRWCLHADLAFCGVYETSGEASHAVSVAHETTTIARVARLEKRVEAAEARLKRLEEE